MADRIPRRRDASLDEIPVHQPPEPDRAAAEKERRAWYKKAAWRRLRAYKLNLNPLCQAHLERGEAVEASHVHHKIDRLERPDLSYDLANLESLCVACHSRISMYRTNKRRGHGESREKT